jgi:hypothetical protein
MNRTQRILEQGKAPVRAIEALETIEPTGPIEPVQAWFLLQAYRRRLRAIVEADDRTEAAQLLAQLGAEAEATQAGSLLVDLLGSVDAVNDYLTDLTEDG